MQDIKNYKDIFNSKNAFILLKHNNKNYNINLLLRIKILYKLLYLLFKKKLNILQNYFLKNLILNGICEFFFIEISILFVLKSDRSLRLYIDY